MRNHLLPILLFGCLLSICAVAQEERIWDYHDTQNYDTPEFYQQTDPAKWDWAQVDWWKVEFGRTELYALPEFYKNLPTYHYDELNYDLLDYQNPDLRYSFLDYRKVDYARIDQERMAKDIWVQMKYIDDLGCVQCHILAFGAEEEFLRFSEAGIRYKESSVSIPGTYRNVRFEINKNGIFVIPDKEVSAIEIPGEDVVYVTTPTIKQTETITGFPKMETFASSTISINGMHVSGVVKVEHGTLLVGRIGATIEGVSISSGTYDEANIEGLLGEMIGIEEIEKFGMSEGIAARVDNLLEDVAVTGGVSSPFGDPFADAVRIDVQSVSEEIEHQTRIAHGESVIALDLQKRTFSVRSGGAPVRVSFGEGNPFIPIEPLDQVNLVAEHGAQISIRNREREGRIPEVQVQTTGPEGIAKLQSGIFGIAVSGNRVETYNPLAPDQEPTPDVVSRIAGTRGSSSPLVVHTLDAEGTSLIGNREQPNAVLIGEMNSAEVRSLEQIAARDGLAQYEKNAGEYLPEGFYLPEELSEKMDQSLAKRKTLREKLSRITALNKAHREQGGDPALNAMLDQKFKEIEKQHDGETAEFDKLTEGVIDVRGMVDEGIAERIQVAAAQMSDPMRKSITSISVGDRWSSPALQSMSVGAATYDDGRIILRPDSSPTTILHETAHALTIQILKQEKERRQPAEKVLTNADSAMEDRDAAAAIMAQPTFEAQWKSLAQVEYGKGLRGETQWIDGSTGPRDTCITPYSCTGWREHVAEFLGQRKELPKLLDRTSPQYAPQAEKLVDILYARGFYTEEQYAELKKATQAN